LIARLRTLKVTTKPQNPSNAPSDHPHGHRDQSGRPHIGGFAGACTVTSVNPSKRE
jgi:hypothetical protein